MANICSTYIQIYPKKRIYFGVEKFQLHKIISELLSQTDGYSYNTPLFVNFGPYGRYLELVYGEKWKPSSIYNYFDNHKEGIDVIFCRYFNDGDDYDFITCLSNNKLLSDINESEDSRKCRYGFDELRFKSEFEMNVPSVESLNGEYYKAKLEGSYLSESDYCNLLHRTNFSEYKIDDGQYALVEIDRKIKCNNESLLEEIVEKALIVEFYYKNKLVTYSIDANEYLKRGYRNPHQRLMEKKNLNWIHFPFDSWYNCVDPIYLNYINTINPVRNTR